MKLIDRMLQAWAPQPDPKEGMTWREQGAPMPFGLVSPGWSGGGEGTKLSPDMGFTPLEQKMAWLGNYAVNDSIPAEMAKAAYRGFTLPGRVFTGETQMDVYDPSTGEMVPNPQVVGDAAELAGMLNLGTFAGVPRGALGSGAVRPKIYDDHAMFSVVPDESVSLYGSGVFSGFDEANIPSVRVNPKGITPSDFRRNFANEWSDRLRSALSKELDPKYDHFWRFTDNKKEAELAKSGLLRNSYNHAENFWEKGLSVADSPHYSVAGYPYGYGVRGELVGYGSDGEPLLNPKNVELVTKLMKAGEINKKHFSMARAIEEKYGLDPDTLKAYSKYGGKKTGFYMPDGGVVLETFEPGRGRVFMRDGSEWK